MGDGVADGPVSTLRGAGVSVDGRRVARVAFGICIATLAVLVVVLSVAGAQKNSNITRLKDHGVPVTLTVSHCQGLLGGSGSNDAGYACSGTLSIGGRRYSESIPGNVLRAPGAAVRAVVVPGNPPLVSTVSTLAGERSSWRVFIVPAVLLVILALLAGGALMRKLHSRSRALADSSSSSRGPRGQTRG